MNRSKIRQKPSHLELLKNGNFLALWLGQAISNLGDWIIIIALIELVYKISGSGLAVGTLMIFKILPALFFGSVIGVLADRFNRKRTMISCDIIRGLLIVLLPFVRNLFQIYLITFVLETFSLLFIPAKDASIPNIVDEEQILTANSLFYTTNHFTMILGVTFGSTIILLVEKVWGHIPFFQRLTGPNAAFYVDAFTFFISAAAITMIYLPPSEHVARRIKYHQIKEDIVDGLRFMKNNPLIRSMMMSIGIAILGMGSIYSLGIIYCYQVLKIGRGGFGYLLSALGVGLTLGSIFTAFLGKHFSKRGSFVASILTLGLALISFASISYYESAIIISFIAGIALALLTVSTYTLLHENVEDTIMGRVFTALESCLRISLLVSIALTGAVADVVGQRVLKLGAHTIYLNGARVTLLMSGMVVIIAGLLAHRSLRIPDSE
ncbi:MAG: MFS transporter [Actinomycetota bacterium]|nr:MFS transporter [Actinomycetota bacterium]